MSKPSKITRAPKLTHNLKSNLPKSLRTTHPSGILYSTRHSSASLHGQLIVREEYCYTWIENLNNNGLSEELVLDYLNKWGFGVSSGGANSSNDEVVFVPYSTRAAWCTRYPHAVPYVECVEVPDENGEVRCVVRGYPLWHPNGGGVGGNGVPREVVEAAGYYGANVSGSGGEGEDVVLQQELMALKQQQQQQQGQKRPRDDKLFSAGIMNNDQRAELHSEIYNYFTWLRTQVKEEGGKVGGKKSIGGISSDALKEVLRSMSEALPGVRSGVAGSASGGGGEEMPLSFLEEGLFTKLKHRVDSGMGASSKRQKKSGGGGGGKGRREKGPTVSWEERLKQLTEYGEVHGHFNVPQPVDVDDDDEVRFYNWVQKINYELRAYNNGKTTKMTKERADQLAAINFKASEAKQRGRPRIHQVIPDVSFKKRLQQMISYKEDVGHLKIDHQYKHCDNLGGWAVEMSEKYQSWKEGAIDVLPNEEEEFHQLKTLGFNFDIKSCYEKTRSWDDHYEKLVEYKVQNGNARVPLKWKADLRLGKWVQLQRKAMRKQMLSQEHRVMLEQIGFEWEVPRDEQPQQQQQQLNAFAAQAPV